MKSLFKRIMSLFKKVFITFSATFLIFLVSYVSYVMISGQWTAALNFERSRTVVMQGDVTEHEAGVFKLRLERRGWVERLNQRFEDLQWRLGRLNDRVLYRAARVWNRI
jgi:hypothetical protein